MIPENIPEVILYNGWLIWGWTGWKGEKSTALCDSGGPCLVCNQTMKQGQVIWLSQYTDPQHWTCRYPDNRPDRLVAQWLAATQEKDWRYLYVNCGGDGEEGEYRRGECFDIGMTPRITESSTESEKEMEKQAGLRRLKLAIDRLTGF